jgi:hypothetical protein
MENHKPGTEEWVQKDPHSNGDLEISVLAGWFGAKRLGVFRFGISSPGLEINFVI